jgi:PST family polysaccharide transporter
MAAEVDLHALGGVVKKALAALVSRTLALQLISLGGTVALARLLHPQDYGVFTIVQFALGILLFFGDTGVGGALVRQKAHPSEEQLSSMFHVQLGVTAIVMVLILAFAGLLPLFWPDLPASAPLILRVMALDFILVCLRIVPSLLLERQMEFGKLAVLEIIGSITFNVVSVSSAAIGWGVWSLVFGVLVQGLFTTIAAYRFCRWRPRAMFVWSALRPLMRFGVAQQLRNVVGLANGAVTPIWGGRVLGTTQVGYVNWAQSTAYFPLKLVEILARIGFPLFAKLQHDRALVGESLGRAIQLSALATFAWVGACLGLGEQLTYYIFSEKWLPALPALLIFAAAISVGFLSPLVAVAFDALGMPGIFARLAIGWTIVNWLAVPFATARWHSFGFAAGYALHVVLGNVAVALITWRVLPQAKLWRRVRAPLCAGALVVLSGRFVLAPRIASAASFALSLALLALLYLAVAWLIDGRALLRAVSVVPGAVDGELDSGHKTAA